MSSERNFKIGRNSEQFYNEELFELYESIKYLLSIPNNIELGPDGNPIDGALWLDRTKNELNKYNKEEEVWENVFKDKFKITDEIMNYSTPDSPTYGQLWINQGVLMYYNDIEWQAVKASSYEDSGLSLSTFQDFLILSPLSETGDIVVDIGGEEKYQYLVPNTKVGKFFLGSQYKYDFEEMNNVSLQYPLSKLLDFTPSWVHVNPGKLKNIKKKLIRIKLESKFIQTSLNNTEFYAFKQDSGLGRFLRPEYEGAGDYYYHHEGIYLSYDIAHSYDYILAVTYEFAWVRNVGRLKRVNSEEQNLSYYMAGFAGPINVFIDGYDLDNKFYSYDQYSNILSLDDPDYDQQNMDSIMMRSIKREYGIIKEVDIELKGIIKLREKYNDPLVFVNGQALHSSLDNIEIDEITGTILIEGATKDMSYSVMELEWDTEEGEEPETLFFKSGYVASGYHEEVVGEPLVEIGMILIENMADTIGEEEGLILFIDGMMIKRDQVIRNYIESYITVVGLGSGQEFLLLHDKNNSFIYDDDNLTYALVTGKIDDSMVYMNNHLICNSAAITTQKSQEDAGKEATDGEIKLFITASELGFAGDYKIWNGYDNQWEEADINTISHVNTIAFSYENSIDAIAINIPHIEEDIFEVYGYNYASTIESPLIINSFMADNEKTFYVSNHFIPKTNSLQIYLDGIRQYEITELIDGSGFELTEEFTGKVTYAIEKPEQGRSKACEREVLDYSNAVEGAINVYRTNISLYPGRITVYVSGLRQPMSSFTILDNNTISFKDKNTMLIKSSPSTHLMGGEEVEIEKTVFDKILIEVRQDYNRKERTINITEDNTQSIKLSDYGIEESILETQDEILIYLNGTFSGLKNNIPMSGYLKNLASKEINILNEDFISILNEDSLYTYLVSNPEAMNKWIIKNGSAYEKNLNNKITLEWR